jgi:hypothetical protein
MRRRTALQDREGVQIVSVRAQRTMNFLIHLPSDPCSARTAKANKRVQFDYGLNCLIDIENTVVVDVEATPSSTYPFAGGRLALISLLEIVVLRVAR